MTSTWWKLGGPLAAVAIVALSVATARAAEDKQPTGATGQAAPAEPQQDAAGTPRAADEATPAASEPQGPTAQLVLPDYWLGIEVDSVPSAICSQLGLKEGEGLLVERVVDGGPADRCGIQRFDILLAAGEVRVGMPADLVKMLLDGKDREIQFQVLRAGKKQTVKVKPERRVDAQARDSALGGLKQAEGKTMELLREQLGKSQMPLRLQFFHPGLLLPPGALTAPIPEDLHLSIDKRGSKPANIVVERGDQRWETTEDKLAELPDDIRPHVEALLGRMPMPKFDVKVEPGAAGVPFRPEASERLEKRLDELNRRMEQMGEQLKRLRGETHEE